MAQIKIHFLPHFPLLLYFIFPKIVLTFHNFTIFKNYKRPPLLLSLQALKLLSFHLILEKYFYCIVSSNLYIYSF